MFLNQTQSANERARKTQVADREVLDRAGGLRPVIGLCRDLHLAHRVRFDSEFSVHAKGSGQRAGLETGAPV